MKITTTNQTDRSDKLFPNHELERKKRQTSLAFGSSFRKLLSLRDKSQDFSLFEETKPNRKLVGFTCSQPIMGRAL